MTLLIIGNGFDLQCDLKSGYEDFFAWLREDKTRVKNNIWAIHFLDKTPLGKQWVDIEERLKEVLTQKTRLQCKNLEDKLGDYDFGTYNDTLINSWPKIAEHNFTYSPEHLNTALEEAQYIIEKHIASVGHPLKFDRNKIDEYWFLEELSAFERQFAEYLKEQEKNTPQYLSKAKILLKKLLIKEAVSIINFNYTNPFTYFRDLVRKTTNVHGTYSENNIILGVDNTVELQGNLFVFSKTHRKMLQGTPDSSVLPKGVRKIKFYGHSLGQADYSYFHSIFDYYNIYGDSVSNTTPPPILQFYFTIYCESKKNDIKRDAVRRVYKLIHTYEAKLGNKDAGKNLLHKLLLEGRIQIEFLGNLK